MLLSLDTELESLLETRRFTDSFGLASRILAREQQESAATLCRWCRYCENEIRQAPNPDEARTRLNQIRKLTRLAFYPDFPPRSIVDHPVFRSLHPLVHRWSIPSKFAFDFLESLESISNEAPSLGDDHLLLHCYRSAGTTALMISCTMGAKDDRAFEHAVSLGNAMQIFRIARDVIEDARTGQVRIPRSRLRAVGWDDRSTPAEFVLSLKNREAIFRCVRDLLRLAFELRAKADAGLKYLPLRSACAAAVASEIHSEIGREIIVRGASAWDEPIFIRPRRKLALALRGIAKVILYSPARIWT